MQLVLHRGVGSQMIQQEAAGVSRRINAGEQEVNAHADDIFYSQLVTAQVFVHQGMALSRSHVRTSILGTFTVLETRC